MANSREIIVITVDLTCEKIAKIRRGNFKKNNKEHFFKWRKAVGVFRGKLDGQ
jgi:hypothetical protein